MGVIGGMKEAILLRNIEKYGEEGANNINVVLKQFVKLAIKIMNEDNLKFELTDEIRGGSDLRAESTTVDMWYYAMSDENIKEFYRLITKQEELDFAGLFIDTSKALLATIKSSELEEYLDINEAANNVLVFFMKELEFIVDKHKKVTIFCNGKYFYTESDYIDGKLSKLFLTILECDMAAMSVIRF